jgi:hypothetical protein
MVAAYFLFGETRGESRLATWEVPSWPVLASGLLIPLVFLLPSLSPITKYNSKVDGQALEKLRGLVQDAAKGGPVLFINERHLVTFGEINVPLVPDYENVTLMEMAMSGNESYLYRFYTDLENHRFAAIVAGKQNTGIMESGSFAEENNVWNTRVAPYILCYYEPVTMIEASAGRIGFYVPRTEQGCP